MRSDWSVARIRDVAIGVYDGPHATPPPASEGAIYLGIGNITADGHLDFSEVRYIAEADLPQWTRRVTPKPGDIVFTYEATLNRYAIIPEGFRGCLGRRTALIRPDPRRVDRRFLLYTFFGREWRDTIEANRLSGATVDRIPIAKFPDFPIRLPPLPIQRRIAAILGAYDDLIEVNRRRIALLEEMARRLFEEWFVHFRFPGHESVRILDAPDGPLPEGWNWVRLGEVLAVLESGFRPKGGIKDGEGDVPSIGAENVNGLGVYDYSKEKFIPRDFFDGMKRGKVKHGDVLLYKDGAHIGRLALAYDGFPHSECAVNEHVFLLRVKEPLKQEYLYFWLAKSDLQHKIRGLNANAAQPGLNKPAVSSLPILLPEPALLKSFYDQVRPTLSMLFALAKANRRLALARDLLLPRLISGELSVAAAERELESAA